MNDYFGYIRVSTAKGPKGSQAQRAAVMQTAKNRGFKVARIFQDQITAGVDHAQLNKMVRLLKAGTGKGVILYKMPRNLTVWLELTKLASSGIPVHFANGDRGFSPIPTRLSKSLQLGLRRLQQRLWEECKSNPNHS